MKNRNALIHLIHSVTLAGLCTTAAYAQVTLPTQTLPEYTVHTLLAPDNLSEATPSLSVYTQDTFATQQWTELTDLLAQTPGIFVAQSGQTGSTSSIFTRGSNGDHTSLVFNGRRLNPGFSGLYSISQFSLSGLSSVEVYRGASTYLYGSEGIGGLIQLVSGGDHVPTGTHYQAEYGSHSTYSANLQHLTRQGAHQLSLGAHYLSTANDLPNSDYDRGQFTLHYDYQLNERVTLDFLSLYLNSSTGIPGNNKSASFPILTDAIDEELYLFSPRIQVQLNEDWTLSSLYSGTGNTLNATDSSFFVSQTRYKTRTDEWDIHSQGNITDDLSTTIGLQYQNIQFNQRDLLAQSEVYQDSWHQWSFYGLLDYQLSSDISLQTALRYADYSDYDSPLTWSLEGQWQALDDTRIFAKVAQAYAAPQAFDLYGPFGNPTLDAEESTAYEIGLKQHFFQQRLQIGATLFRNELENLIDFVNFATANVGEARTQGLELALAYRHDAHHYAYANLTLLEATNEVTQQRLLRRPSATATIGYQYTCHNDALIGLSASTAMDREDVDGGTFARIDAEDYTTLRLYGEYPIKDNITLTARIENLLDEDYSTVDGYPALGRSIYVGVKGSF